MANAVLFISYGVSKVGRERMAFELFTHTINFWGKLQAEKKIDSFEPVMLQPHGGDLNGFMLIRGEHAKLDAIRQSDEFVEIEARAKLCLDGLRVVMGKTNEALHKGLQILQKNIPAS